MLPTSWVQGPSLCLPGRDSQSSSFMHSQGCRRGRFWMPRVYLATASFESQHFHSPHISSFATYILSCCPCFGPSGTCGRRVGSLENCVDPDFRATQLHPESLLLENHLSKSARGILKDSRWFHTWVFKVGFCFTVDVWLPPWFCHLQNGSNQLCSTWRMRKVGSWVWCWSSWGAPVIRLVY